MTSQGQGTGPRILSAADISIRKAEEKKRSGSALGMGMGLDEIAMQAGPLQGGEGEAEEKEREKVRACVNVDISMLDAFMRC